MPTIAPVIVPSCNNQTAMIYVDGSGTIRGGSDTGKPYAGTLNGTKNADVIAGTSSHDVINSNDTICALGDVDLVNCVRQLHVWYAIRESGSNASISRRQPLYMRISRGVRRPDPPDSRAEQKERIMSTTQDWNTRNRAVINEFRANAGKVKSNPYPLMLLNTIGAKSGQPRINPLCYSTDGDRIIIASKGAAPTHPDWYYNLVANPEVTVEVGSARYQARAIVAAGDERQRLFDQQAALMPFFAGYAKKTKRQIPVVILERIT